MSAPAMLQFNGDFTLLPFEASMRYGEVPSYPTDNEFQNATASLSDDLCEYAAAHWHIDAIRERRLNPGRSLDDAAHDIAARVARRLYELGRAA